MTNEDSDEQPTYPHVIAVSIMVVIFFSLFVCGLTEINERREATKTLDELRSEKNG